MSKQFYDTKKLFVEYTHYDHPLTYEEWMASNSNSKAALLYIQYFDEILTAWYKLESSFPYIDVEESVETVLQYLEKNVSKIEESPKKYSSSYIYTVAYNCLYCISHDRIGQRYRYYNEMSNVVSDDGEELDIFDTLVDDKNATDKNIEDEDDPVRKYFWETIEDCGKDSMSVVMELLTGYKDPDCHLGWKKKGEVMDKLQEELSVYLDYYNNGKSWN